MSTSNEISLPPLLDDLGTGIVLHEPETGAILDVNDRATNLYGYSREDLQTSSVDKFTPPSTKFSPERAVRRIQAAARDEPQEFEWQIERANGEVRWVRVHLHRASVDDTACVIAEIKDITEYRARERRLRLLSRIVRHNLRNKTNVIMGYTDRIRGAVEDERLEEELETIQNVTSEVGTLSESVRQLEEIAEPDATRRSPMELCSLSQTVLTDFQEEYPEVDFNFEATDRVWVVADRGLRYALSHAIENAIEHNEQDVPRVTVTVVEEAANHRGVIQIADNGPVIPPSETDVLNAEVETTSTYHGSGVGLWIMDWCVESLGGELAFEENTPEGNIVSMGLPKTAPPDDDT